MDATQKTTSLAMPSDSAWRPGRIVAATVLVLLALVALWKLLPMHEYLRIAIALIQSLGPLGMAAYVLIYVVCAVLGIPRTLLNLAAGVIFSYFTAVALVLAGATAAYAITFTIARTIARDWVNRRLAKSEQVKQVLDLVEAEGFKLILLVRMNPFIPGVIKGYGFGTTNVAFGTYLLASVLGFLPLALAHVYLGWVGGAAVLSRGAHLGAFEIWLMAGGLVLSLILVAGIYVYGRRAMNKRYPEMQS